jgi:U6 snRNA-associated Sm-like protein LSm7
MQSQQQKQQKQKQFKDSIVDLSKFQNKRILVKFSGTREGKNYSLCTYSEFICIASGILKGWDKLLNIILDDCTDNQQRHLGLVMCRGTSVVVIIPEEGKEQVSNPFLIG